VSNIASESEVKHESPLFWRSSSTRSKRREACTSPGWLHVPTLSAASKVCHPRVRRTRTPSRRSVSLVCAHTNDLPKVVQSEKSFVR